MSPLNAIFAILWFLLGVEFVSQGVRKKGRDRAFFVSAGLVFVVFSVSDVVEVFSGAWWRPWWLLLIKVLCGVAMLTIAFVFRDPSATHQDSEGNTVARR